MKLKLYAASFFLTLPLAGCTVTSVGEPPNALALPQSFLTNATKLKVNPPVSRYSSRFYNLKLGKYAVNNTQINRRTSGAKEYQGLERVQNAWWDVDLNGIQLRWGDYHQYQISDHKQFAFQLANQSGQKLRSNCNSGSFYLEREANSSLTVTLFGDGSGSNPGIEWIRSILHCNIQQNQRLWQLAVVKHASSTPELTLSSGGIAYQLRPASSDGNGSNATGEIQGVSIYKANRQIAAVSTIEPWNTIWLDNSLSAQEHELLLGAAYSMILWSWLSNT